MIAPLLLALTLTADGCYPVLSGDRITGAHLAAADARWAALPADLFIGYAPQPGLSRRLRPEELRRLAAAHGIADDGAQSLCLAWPMAAPDHERFEEAMRQALGMPEASIKILETARQPLPPGTLHFPMTAMSARTAIAAAQGVLWRGYVDLGDGRRFPTWARVKVAVPYSRVVAAAAIARGETIRPEHLRLEQVTGFPTESLAAARLEDVIGRVPLVAIADGAIIELRQLQLLRDVVQGQLVKVDLNQGPIRCKLEAKAESSGRTGETVVLKNMASGKLFRATVSGPGQVVVR